MIEVRSGAMRTVVLVGRWAFKFPGRPPWRHPRWWWGSFLRGLQANMQEAAFSRTGWPELCPVVLHVPGGFLTVMRRARPLTGDEMLWVTGNYRRFVTRGDRYADANFEARMDGEEFDPDDATHMPMAGLYAGRAEPEGLLIPAELKESGFGVLDGRVVAVDYG